MHNRAEDEEAAYNDVGYNDRGRLPGPRVPDEDDWSDDEGDWVDAPPAPWEDDEDDWANVREMEPRDWDDEGDWVGAPPRNRALPPDNENVNQGHIQPPMDWTKNSEARYRNQLSVPFADAFVKHPKMIGTFFNIPKHCRNPEWRFGRCNCTKGQKCDDIRRCRNYGYFLVKHPFLLLLEDAPFNELMECYTRFFSFVISEHVHQEQTHTQEEAAADVRIFLWQMENGNFSRKLKTLIALEMFRCHFGINRVLLENQNFLMTSYHKSIELSEDFRRSAPEFEFSPSIADRITGLLFEKYATDFTWVDKLGDF